MTDDELITKAIEKLRALEARRKDVPERLRTVTVDRLPERCIRDAVIIDFEGGEVGGRIQISMDRESGEMIWANYSPAKDASDEATPTI
jgi:hypothetical protein